MNKRDTEECLKRAKECARQADAAVDPELKIYLMKLALSWTQAAGETVERELRASSGRGANAFRCQELCQAGGEVLNGALGGGVGQQRGVGHVGIDRRG